MKIKFEGKMSKEDPMMLTNTVSSTGIFLQFLILRELDRLNLQKRNFRGNWNYEIEYPVRLSPFFKDLKRKPSENIIGLQKLLEREDLINHINSCQIQSKSEETRIDIVASSSEIIDSPYKSVKFVFCIECKKLDPDYATWIFFNTKDNSKMNLISKNKEDADSVTLLEIPGTIVDDDKGGNTIYLQLMQKWNLEPIRHTISDASVAINKKEKERGKKDMNFYKRDFDKIDSAARQIVKGTYGYILDALNHQIVSNNEEYDFNNIIYFPIIVTTAELKIANFDPDKISLRDGFLSEPLKLDSTDSIIYEVGSPDSVRFPSSDFSKLDLDKKKSISKWHVLIMTVEGFMKFLKNMENERDLFLP